MAVIVDATGTKLITTVAGTTVNYTGITVGTGVDRALVVTVACAAAVTAPNAHWDTAGANQAMTLITAVETATNCTTFMFGLRNPVAGAKTLNVAWTTSAASNVEAISFTDVDQTSDAKAFINANFVKDGATVASILMALNSPSGSIAVASYGTSATFSSLTGTNLFTDITNTGCEGAASRANGAGANINFTGADTTTTGNKVMVGFVVAPVIPVLHEPWQSPALLAKRGLAIALMASGLFSAPLPPKEDVAKVDRWYSAWRDPVWPKRGLAAHEQQFLAWSPGLTKEDIPRLKWANVWEQPLRAKLGLAAYEQQFLAWDPQPITASTATAAVILLNSEVIFKNKVIYQALAEPVNFTTATTTWTTWTPWPDLVPTRKKPVADFRPWTFLEPPPQVFFPYAPWDDFTRRKQPPLDTQPLAWSTFTPVQVVTYFSAAWPDFATKKQPPLNYNPLTFVQNPQQVFFPYAPWDDFARRKPKPIDTQPLAWSTFTPAQVVTYFNAAWPDFAPGRTRAADFIPWTFIPSPAQVFFPYDRWQDSAPTAKRTVEYPYLAFVAPQPPWNVWTIWPDQVPTRKKTAADLVPWTFIPTPAQVFFPYAPWDDFARRKQPPLDTQPLAEPITVEPTLVSKWFEGLSLPPGPKRGLGTHLQSSYTNDTIAAAIQLFARTPWYTPLSEPVRIKRGLRPELQKFTERDLFVAFVPIVYLATLTATEQGDFLTAVLSQFNTPISAYVDIVQNDPRQRGNLGVIENVAQSSIIASIAEPQTVPATGQPVSAVAGARVAIIVQGAGP